MTENKFGTTDLFTNGENYRGKTPSGEFKVTTPENQLLSKLAYDPRNARTTFIYYSWKNMYNHKNIMTAP